MSRFALLTQLLVWIYPTCCCVESPNPQLDWVHIRDWELGSKTEESEPQKVLGWVRDKEKHTTTHTTESTLQKTTKAVKAATRELLGWLD